MAAPAYVTEASGGDTTVDLDFENHVVRTLVACSRRGALAAGLLRGHRWTDSIEEDDNEARIHDGSVR